MKGDFMKKIEIIFLLDKSGSMAGLEADTIGGYNSFIEKQKKIKGEVTLTTVLFDSYCSFFTDGIPIGDVKPLKEKDYHVGGSTALMDAIGFAIERVEQRSRNKKVIFVITTDGMENASRKYSKAQIKEMIKAKKNWEFIYLGANIDAYQEGMSIGISKERISNYQADRRSTKAMYRCLKEVVSSLANNQELKENWNAALEK